MDKAEMDKVKILLVDDEPGNLLSMEAALECLGQEIVKAKSGEEALQSLLKDEFAVILLDGHMSGLNGFETAALIRQRPRSRHTPIIFVTGSFISEEMMFKGYSSGAVDYIIKPAVTGILRAKVEVFIELARIQKRLQAEIDERTRIAAEIKNLNLQLEKKNGELQAANSNLEAFSYSVAHDLRAPLAHIMGYLDLVAMSDVKLGAELKECLQKVKKGAGRMEELIRDLLSFAKVGHVKLSSAPLNLTNLVKEIVQEDISTDGRNIDWEIDELPEVIADKSLLRQVFGNLLSNAVKYSRIRERAKIEVACREKDSEFVFFVRDNGAGFDMKSAEKLFGVFQRLHSQDEFEGTGVGLANVRRIVQKHGGRTWAEGKVNEGSTFYFSLPK